MAFNPQFKINQMAKDMGLKSKELTDLLASKDWCLIRRGEDTRAFSPPTHRKAMRAHSEKTVIYKPESGPSPDPESAHTLVLDLWPVEL